MKRISDTASRRYMTSSERRLEIRLQKLERELPPGHEMDYVVFNVLNDEYVLGKTPEEAKAAFEKRWPNAPFFRCRADGGPFTKMYGCRQ